jgi:4-oxalocrotonate tautomerase family enzyme
MNTPTTLGINKQTGGDHVPLIMMYFGKGALADGQKVDLSRKVTDLVVNESKQPKEGTWVVINEIPAENWLLGGLTLPEFKAMLVVEKT